MNTASQRSLNAGWTRHTNTRPAPQVRPVTITLHTGTVLTGAAWLRGQLVNRAALYADVLAARMAYQAGINNRVFTDVVIIHNTNGAAEMVSYSDIKRISEGTDE